MKQHLPKLATYYEINRHYKRIVKENKEVFDFYINSIDLMHKIVEDLTKVKAREYLKTKEHTTGGRAISELYEIKILHSFIAHKTLLKSGIVIGSYSHLRTIFETLLKIYLNIIEPKLGELNYKYEIIDNLNVSKNEKKEIMSEYRKHSYLKQKYVEEKLYSDITLKQTREFYSHICTLIHPSIKSLGACFQVKENTLIDSTKLGIGLTVSNFLILFELYNGKIKKKYKRKLLSFEKLYQKYIPEGVPQLVPNKKTDNLNFQSFSELLDYLKGQVRKN